ncbi:MAG TPA: CoA-transferase [Myxococcota bacterium]|nr:CoA-transferase [Myxococcota bacterium]HRY94386.1 CoA-transferase [Myxococcota bacterium]HSA20000.1 CoA-transferase [Myxococcota bacterium]
MAELKSGRGPLIRMLPPDEVRAWMRANKPKGQVSKLMTEREAIAKFVRPEQYVGVELYGGVRCPMSLVRELVRQRIGPLDLAGQGVLENDMLIAAGLVRRLDITYHGYEVYGTSPILRRACESGKVQTVEWSNAALAWRFKAAAMGLPFLPVRSMLGTGTFDYSGAKEILCPFTGVKLCAIPALHLDVGLIHVHRADEFGNCQIDGITGFAAEMARASKRLIVSAEEIVPHLEIQKAPDRTLIPYFIVDAVVHAPGGSLPGEMPYLYWRDDAHIKAYMEAVQTEEGAQRYLQEWVHGTRDHTDFVKKLGGEKRLAELRAEATTR